MIVELFRKIKIQDVDNYYNIISVIIIITRALIAQKKFIQFCYWFSVSKTDSETADLMVLINFPNRT
jgi:hypothetical protein